MKSVFALTCAFGVAFGPRELFAGGSCDAAKQAEYGGVLGFWPFSEGTVGETIVGAENFIDPSDKLVGAALGTSGQAPTYSDDVPGDRIYVGSPTGQLYATGIRSAKFYGQSSSASVGGGKLTFPDIRSRVASSGAFTLEFFFKYDDDLTWRNVFAMANTSTDSFKVCNRTTLHSFVIQGNVGSDKYERYTSATITPNLNEIWHHVALEWSAETQVLSVYLDYRLYVSQGGITFDSSTADGYFGCARGGVAGEFLSGKIAAIRLMPRCLEPEEMLVAYNGPLDEKTVFYWSFEDEGAVADAEINLTSAQPLDNRTLTGTASYSVSKLPTYSTEVWKPARTVLRQGAAIVATNGYSAYFYGRSVTHDNLWSGSHIENLYPQSTNSFIRPASFTFETFLCLDKVNGKTGGYNGRLVAGFGGSGINTQLASSDWVIYLGMNVDTISFRCYLEDGTMSASSALEFPEGWHHLAFTYDDEKLEAVLYIDYQPVCTKTLTQKMRRTTDKQWCYAVGRGFNSSGVTGWMDDIRVSSCVRPVREFLRKGGSGGFALLLR